MIRPLHASTTPQRTFESQLIAMMAAAKPFSCSQIVIAAATRCASVIGSCGGAACIMASCAAECACRRPSCGVLTHQTMANQMTQAVERAWSKKKKCAK